MWRPGRVHEPAIGIATGPISGKPALAGGAPGGAGPYVTGAAHPGWRARWHARAARAGPFAKDRPREPRKLPWGLANPWRLPALHHLASAREEKGIGRTRRPKTKNTGGGALATAPGILVLLPSPR